MIGAAALAVASAMGQESPEEIRASYENGIPKRMELGKTPKEICALYDVYLDGVQQFDCVVADTEKNFVVRYVRTNGIYVRGRHGGIRTERINGRVCIVKKGDPCPQEERGHEED